MIEERFLLFNVDNHCIEYAPSMHVVNSCGVVGCDDAG